MAKSILILSTSLRAGSNSETLANAFADGARAAGHTVEVISLRGKNIAFCRGCLACQTLGRCVIDDNAVAITEKMQHADVIAFATPIYYYEMSGQLKTLLDRANALFPSDYAFRDIYLLASATEDEPDTDERAIHGLEGWIACYENGAGRCRRAPRTRDRPRHGRGHRINPALEVCNHEQHPDPYAGMGQDVPAK